MATEDTRAAGIESGDAQTAEQCTDNDDREEAGGWLSNATAEADDLHADTEAFLDDVADGEADTEAFRQLERQAIETLITIRDAAHAWEQIEVVGEPLETSEDLLRAAHSVDDGRPELAVDRIEQARDKLADDRERGSE